VISRSIAIGALSIASSLPALADSHVAISRDIELVGSHPLQARSAYQPHPHRYPDGRYILFVGHHSGEARNPQTGEIEQNGTSIIDVTDPASPVYLKHLPGAAGAQMAQACNGEDIPGGDPDKVYLLRSNGSLEHQVWDVTYPAEPHLISTPQTDLEATHRNWWQCDTGVAYLVSDLRPRGWTTHRGLQVFDLRNPAEPKLIRNYALPGMTPGGDGDHTGTNGVHEATVSADGSKVFLPYGTGANGVIQILDNEKLINGDPSLDDPYAETASNMLYPQLSMIRMRRLRPTCSTRNSGASTCRNTGGHIRSYRSVASRFTTTENSRSAQAGRYSFLYRNPGQTNAWKHIMPSRFSTTPMVDIHGPYRLTGFGTNRSIFAHAAVASVRTTSILLITNPFIRDSSSWLTSMREHELSTCAIAAMHPDQRRGTLQNGDTDESRRD
jgi:hypothetical protein